MNAVSTVCVQITYVSLKLTPLIPFEHVYM